LPILVGTLAVAGAVTAAGLATPTEFVVENSVFEGKQSLGGSKTIFVGGKAYDFLRDSAETVVFDPSAGRIMLTDSERRIRSELTIEQLAEFVENMRKRALQGASDFARFSAQPDFGERLDAETNELVLSSPLLEYRARTTAPKNADVLRSYQAFLHWQAQRNCALNPGAMPPQARLKLNDALAARQLLPEQVSMRRAAGAAGPARTLRAEHAFQWRVDEEDRRRVNELEQRLGSFRVVSIGEYLQTEAAK
jgi:hypothetical protein